MTAVREFALAFWRAMGNRDNNLKAIRDALIALGVAAYVLGVVALAQAVG